jgi:hypothetical protein
MHEPHGSVLEPVIKQSHAEVSMLHKVPEGLRMIFMKAVHVLLTECNSSVN